MNGPTTLEVQIVACADAWSPDGEILASPTGAIPRLGAGLAKLTSNPDLLLTDGEARLVDAPVPLGADASDVAIEGWMPFRHIFDHIWNGRRHVMMSAAQIDQYGNTNISCIGDWRKPTAQLIGMRGAPGNTAYHVCSYWIPKHTPRVFVDQVDVVSGLGYEPSCEATRATLPHHEIRRVITNLAVLDFESPDRRMRLRSVHPGVRVDTVVEQTGFELVVPDDVPTTRAMTPQEHQLIDDVLDPHGQRLHA